SCYARCPYATLFRSRGIFGWVLRNAFFSTHWLALIAVVGLPLHGMCFTFFFVVTNLFVDRHAPPHLRASAQGILMFTVSGFGTLTGNIMSARVLEFLLTDGHVAWGWFWLVPAAASAIVFLLLGAGFRDGTPVRAEPALTEGTRATPATV